MALIFDIEIAQEDDGRWIAEVSDLGGVMPYGQTRDEAIARVQALALRVIAERLEHAEAPAELLAVTFRAAWATGPPPKPSTAPLLHHWARQCARGRRWPAAVSHCANLC